MGMYAALGLAFAFVIAEILVAVIFFIFYGDADTEIQLWMDNFLVELELWISEKLQEFKDTMDWLKGIKIADDPNLDAYKANKSKPKGVYIQTDRANELFSTNHQPLHFESWEEKVNSS